MSFGLCPTKRALPGAIDRGSDREGAIVSAVVTTKFHFGDAFEAAFSKRRLNQPGVQPVQQGRDLTTTVCKR